MPTDVKHLRDWFADLENERMPHHALWGQIGQFIRPVRDDFVNLTALPSSAGVNPDPNVFDSTAFTSIDNFMSGIYGLMTNPANVWFQLGLLDKGRESDDETIGWLDEVSRVMLRSFGPAVSGFYEQAPSMIGDWGGFGTGVFWSEPIAGEPRIHDVCLPLGQCYLVTDDYGRTVGLFRKYPTTAFAAKRRFGEQRLSKRLTDLAAKSPQARVFIHHACVPNEDYDAGRLGWRGKRYLSVYFEDDGDHEISRGGYDELPFQAATLEGQAGSAYGMGRGRLALPDIKQLNIMEKALAITMERIADPTWLTVDESEMPAIKQRPGEIVAGGLDEQGRQMVQLLQQDARGLPYTLDKANQLREAIKDTFYFSIMQLVGRTGMTATEILTRDQEKMRLIGPHQGRLQTGWLSPLIGRRFRMLERLGQLPPPPQSLVGAEIEVIYVSPMAQAQKSLEAAASTRLAESAALIAQIDPEAVDAFDGTETLRTIREGLGAPPSNLRGKEAIAQRRQMREQAAANQQMLTGGEQAANIAAKIGQAAGAMQAR